MQLSDKFFTFDTGEKSHFFDIITSSGLSLSLFSIGASIQKIAFKGNKWSDHPETYGNELPITLSSGNPDFYRICPCYAGATLAPNAGRISGSSILLGGETIPLTPNEGANQLHGGPHNLSAQNWNTEFVRQDYDSVSIGFSAFLADGVDGYPGNRTFHAEYTLDDSNWLTIRYRASTDRPTYINMSNHTYWNLSGDFSSSALDETLTVFANNVCLNNEEHIPVEIIPIARTIFDFSSPASLKSRLDFLPREEKLRSRCCRQISIARGYNHAFILSRDQTSRNFRSLPQPVRKACILSDPVSGHSITLYTDAPALVVYSGGFLDDSIGFPDGTHSCPSCAIALEAQDVPDSPHVLPEHFSITTPEHPFERTIRIQIR